MMMPCASCGYGTCCMSVTDLRWRWTASRRCARPLPTAGLSVTNNDDGGAICAGAPADILLLDWAAIDEDRLRDDIDPLLLVLTRATARHVRELIVAGRTVVKDGSVIGVDAEAARAEIMTVCATPCPTKRRWRRRFPLLERAIAKHFEPNPACF